jgi:hypothetical protein
MSTVAEETVVANDKVLRYPEEIREEFVKTPEPHFKDGSQ